MRIYRLLLIALSPLLAAYILGQSIRAKSPRYFRQRLGFGYNQLPENSLWFHCASVGEVITLLPLLKDLHRKNPALKFIITSNTVTGGKIITQQNLDYLFHSYLPFDWVSAIKRFINKTKPASLFIMETEIWPNLFSVCHDNGIAIHMINARLSSKTTTAKPWIKALLKTALSKVSSISARSEEDALSYAQLGADKNIISTAGNLKFTSVLDEQQTTAENDFSVEREYVLVASTHENEEAQIYRHWKKLNRDELLIIAPRHPERAGSIIRQLSCRELAQRSKHESISKTTEVFLLDTVGELKNYFARAKLVIMGGSFVPVGGHNILEPARYRRAIITGPYMENFRQELALMKKQEAIMQLASVEALTAALKKLLDEKESRETLQNNSSQLTGQAEKILQKYTDIIQAAS